MKTVHLVLTIALVASVLGSSASATALDQVFEPPGSAAYQGNISSTFYGSFVDHAQTFTVGKLGRLDQVQILIDRTQLSSDLLVDVRPTMGGAPVQDDKSALASAIVPVSAVSPFPFQWVSVDLSVGALRVTPGQQLALVLRTRSTYPNDQEYAWRGDAGDPYLRGSAYFRSSSEREWKRSMGGFPFTPADYGFRTYVTQIPEPSTLSLLCGGILLGLCSYGHRRVREHVA